MPQNSRYKLILYCVYQSFFVPSVFFIHIRARKAKIYLEIYHSLTDPEELVVHAETIYLNETGDGLIEQRT